MNYSPVGSSAGIAAISAKQVNFGASDVPMNASEQAPAKGGPVTQVPDALGAEGIAYNLDLPAGARLHLTGPVLEGRLDEAERLAAGTARSIEPTFSAPPGHVAAWGSLLMMALAPAAAAGHDVADSITLASSGAERIGGQIRIYNTTFAPASVATQTVHAHAILRQPAKALQAARTVNADELPGTIWRGRHLLDVAQAQVDARHGPAATTTLARARTMAPVWFRHQGVARSLVLELCEQQRRLTPQLRELATSIDAGSYAPYHPCRRSTTAGREAQRGDRGSPPGPAQLVRR